jgi:hypothetical protein
MGRRAANACGDNRPEADESCEDMPARCTTDRARIPERGKAQGRIANRRERTREQKAGASVTASGPQAGTEAQKSNANATPIRLRPFSITCKCLTSAGERRITPTKINRGGRTSVNDTWARQRAETHEPPAARDQTCEGYVSQTPRAPPGDDEGRTQSSGQAAKVRAVHG